MKGLLKVIFLSTIVVLLIMTIGSMDYIHYCGEVGTYCAGGCKISPIEQILGSFLDVGFFLFSIICFLLFFEIFLFKKTQYGFSKKLYLIILFLLLFFIAFILAGGIIASSFQDGIAGGIFMGIIIEFGGAIWLFITVRLILQHLFLNFFQKLFIFFNKYFIIFFLFLFVFVLALNFLIFFDYDTKGKYIGLSKKGLKACEEQSLSSGDLEKAWDDMNYEEQINKSKEFLKLDKEKQRWTYERFENVSINFPVDKNFYLKSTETRSNNEYSIVLENKLLYLKADIKSNVSKNVKEVTRCEEKTVGIKNVKIRVLSNTSCGYSVGKESHPRPCSVYTWFDNKSKIYNLCGETTRDEIEIIAKENGVKIIEEIFNSIEYYLN